MRMGDNKGVSMWHSPPRDPPAALPISRVRVRGA